MPRVYYESSIKIKRLGEFYFSQSKVISNGHANLIAEALLAGYWKKARVWRHCFISWSAQFGNVRYGHPSVNVWVKSMGGCRLDEGDGPNRIERRNTFSKGTSITIWWSYVLRLSKHLVHMSNLSAQTIELQSYPSVAVMLLSEILKLNRVTYVRVSLGQMFRPY